MAGAIILISCVYCIRFTVNWRIVPENVHFKKGVQDFSRWSLCCTTWKLLWSIFTSYGGKLLQNLTTCLTMHRCCQGNQLDSLVKHLLAQKPHFPQKSVDMNTRAAREGIIHQVVRNTGQWYSRCIRVNPRKDLNLSTAVKTGKANSCILEKLKISLKYV